MSSESENIAAKSFTIFLFTLIIGIIILGDLAWIIATVLSLGYAITKKKSKN